MLCGNLLRAHLCSSAAGAGAPRNTYGEEDVLALRPLHNMCTNQAVDEHLGFMDLASSILQSICSRARATGGGLQQLQYLTIVDGSAMLMLVQNWPVNHGMRMLQQ